jgi:hypothetical protein
MLTLNVGISRKQGLPDYSSLGADCHLSLELPGDLLDHPEELRKRIQLAYAIAAQAVADELARQSPPPAAAGRQTAQEAPGGAPAAGRSRGRSKRPEPAREPASPVPGTGTDTGNGRYYHGPRQGAHERKDRPDGRGEEIRGGHAPASERQTKAIYAIAKSLGIDIDDLFNKYGIHTLSDLTIRRASDIIDALKARESQQH